MRPIRHADLPVLNTGNCILKPLECEHITDEYVGWLNDKDVNSFLEARFFTHTQESVRQFLMSQIECGRVLFYGIWSSDNFHVGNIKLGPIDMNHLSGDLGFLIGNRSYWGRGIASSAVEKLSQFAFSLGLKKITAGAYETNIASIKVLQKAGFKREGYRESQVISGSERVGTLLFGRCC
jgi:ribosomal-protein-alanine N-acetyltransferase